MKDFGQWLLDARVVVSPDIDELPEGIVEMKPDSGYPRYMAYCCVCDELTELPVDIGEVPQEGYEHYCGGSPRCVP